MKYIRFKNVGMVLFEGSMGHDEMARKIKDKPVSAGFVYIDECFDDGKPICSGCSATLKLKMDEEDECRIRFALKR
jgi:hypothetical protein